jgi:hypothetical protein
MATWRIAERMMKQEVFQCTKGRVKTQHPRAEPANGPGRSFQDPYALIVDPPISACRGYRTSPTRSALSGRFHGCAIELSSGSREGSCRLGLFEVRTFQECPSPSWHPSWGRGADHDVPEPLARKRSRSGQSVPAEDHCFLQGKIIHGYRMRISLPWWTKCWQ